MSEKIDFFRLHHVRPRFKNDIENVLLYMATEISKLEEMPLKRLNEKIFDAIRIYPGNLTRADKTIHNWRTEISALFGFVEEDRVRMLGKPSAMAKKLAETQDLVQFFKYFLFHFQYPGGHIKAHKLIDLIHKNIRFKPAQCLLKVLQEGEMLSNKRFSINKAEATHFIFNNLNVTRGNYESKQIVELIIKNRKKGIELDWKGDVIRYAGDILDYMVIADLLVLHGSKYYINWNDREAIYTFISDEKWFSQYDKFYDNAVAPSNLDLENIEDNWFKYVNRDLGNDLFKTDVLKWLGEEIDTIPEYKFNPDKVRNTKEIGDYGEALVHGHECMRLKLLGKENLIHLVKHIPTYLALGYDISSRENDAKMRYVEVKTTISNKSLNFKQFHLTPNEWASADTNKKHYYVYRLMISKNKKKLFIINDPVGQYKKNTINMVMRDGADMTFTNKSGKFEELLTWKE